MKLQILTVQYPPDLNSIGYLMHQLARGLSARGHDVSVLTSFPHYAKFRVEDEYRGRLWARAKEDGIDVLRLGVLASGRKEHLTHRMVSYLSFNAAAVVANWMSRPGADVVLCPNGAFLSGMAAHWSLGQRGVPYVYNVQDLYPEVPAAYGRLKNPRFLGLIDRAVQHMYDRAAHVTVIAPSFRRRLLERGVPPEKVTVVPNFADTHLIRPGPRQNPWSARHDLDDAFVVMYAGNMGFAYELESTLEVARRMRGDRSVRFLLVGDGIARAPLAAKARSLGLDNVRFLPFQPREELEAMRAAADVQLAPARRGASVHSLPSKVYEVMASARPLIAACEAQSDVAGLLAESGAGLRVEPEDPDGLEAGIRRLRENPSEGQRLGRAGRAYVEAHASVDAAVRAYDSLLGRVAHQRRA